MFLAQRGLGWAVLFSQSQAANVRFLASKIYILKKVVSCAVLRSSNHSELDKSNPIDFPSCCCHRISFLSVGSCLASLITQASGMLHDSQPVRPAIAFASLWVTVYQYSQGSASKIAMVGVMCDVKKGVNPCHTLPPRQPH
jgi:hypothetical protein